MGETSVFWDDRDGGPLRVMVDVSELRPRRVVGSIASDDFIRAADGSFVGE